MGRKPNPLAQRIKTIGIANGYAYDLANGKREPSLKLALQIWAKTGDRLGPIAHADEAQLDALLAFHGVAA
jgi:hypothetical protein